MSLENHSALTTDNVPCNGCTLCCQGDALRLLPGDDTTLYQTEPHFMMKDALMLAHKAGGNCVYLATHGCSIQSTKPQMCREMDCRRIAQTMTWTQARKLSAKGAFKKTLWQRGRDLLRGKS